MKDHFNLYKLAKINKVSRGSMTVELSLIFPFILLTIIAVMYIVIILYQYAQLQSLVNHTAEEASNHWGKLQSPLALSSMMKTGKVEGKDLKNPLYWRLILLDDTKKKEEKVADYLRNQLEEFSILAIKSSHVTVNYKDYILHKEVDVTAKVKYHLPIPIIKPILGIGEGYTINASSKSTIKDSTEVIRTVDFVADTMEDFEITKAIKSKHQEILKWIKEKISDYFK